MYYYPQQQYNTALGYMQPTAQIQPQPQVQGLKGRPVSSIDEVRAAQIDFDGSLFIFPDIANKKIYTKQINYDGTASLNVFELKEGYEPSPTSIYVTREELDVALAQLKEMLMTPQSPVQEVPAKPALNF